MERHPFHEAIRQALSTIDTGSARLVWDSACGGSQLVSLFREDTKSRSTKYTCVDGILHDDSVRPILEIEEAGQHGFRPHRILGKLCTAALCRSFIPRHTHISIPLAPRVTFVQVASNTGLQTGSRKRLQYENLENDVRSRLLPMGRRLISRLRHREFGILVTTSFLGHQAYQELRSDRHPVVVIAGADIAAILVKAGLGTTAAVREWLTTEFPALLDRARDVVR